MSLFLVLEAIVLIWKLMQARSEQNNLRCEDGKLSFLALLDPGLGCSASRVANYANDVSTAQMFVLCFEWNASLRNLLSLGHNLHLNSLSPNIIKYQLISCRPLVVDSPSYPYLNILARLPGLDRVIVLDKISDVVIDLELMRVWIGILGLSELVDIAGSDLEILLCASVS
jgi:hypothetical protein